MTKHWGEIERLADPSIDKEMKRKIILKPGGVDFSVVLSLRWDGSKTAGKFGDDRQARKRAQRKKKTPKEKNFKEKNLKENPFQRKNLKEKSLQRKKISKKAHFKKTCLKSPQKHVPGWFRGLSPHQSVFRKPNQSHDLIEISCFFSSLSIW